MWGYMRSCLAHIFSLTVGWTQVFFQLLYGVIKLSHLPEPRVTIFGGSRFKPDDRYAQLAKQLSEQLAKRGVSVMTGGGPGIMEASDCGAALAGKGVRSMGVSVKDLGIEAPSACSQIHITLKYFFARKWLLTRYSIGFVIFPGGFGTLDELGEVLTLIKTKKMNDVPVILFGVEFWQPLVDWFKSELLQHNLITQEDLSLLTLTDSFDDLVSILSERCDECFE